jgi:hypothetical protein
MARRAASGFSSREILEKRTEPFPIEKGPGILLLELHGRIRYYLYYRVRSSRAEVLALWHSSREDGPRL